MLSICSGLLLEGPCARGSRGKLVLELMFELKGWLQQLSGEQKKLEKELAGQGEGSGEDSEGQPHPHGEDGKQDNKICKILAHWRPPKIGKMSSALFPSTM